MIWIALRWRLFLLLVMLTATGCVNFYSFPLRSDSISIEEPVMARGIDEEGNPVEPTSVFGRADRQIYCVVAFRGPENLHLGARWYYGEVVVADYVINLGKRQHGFWQLTTKQGQPFPPGDYRVEIYVIKEPLKTIHFKVEE